MSLKQPLDMNHQGKWNVFGVWSPASEHVLSVRLALWYKGVCVVGDDNKQKCLECQDNSEVRAKFSDFATKSRKSVMSTTQRTGSFMQCCVNTTWYQTNYSKSFDSCFAAEEAVQTWRIAKDKEARLIRRFAVYCQVVTRRIVS
jgi:hypothetical protein